MHADHLFNRVGGFFPDPITAISGDEHPVFSEYSDSILLHGVPVCKPNTRSRK
jgi:hypothetical protein